MWYFCLRKCVGSSTLLDVFLTKFSNHISILNNNNNDFSDRSLMLSEVDLHAVTEMEPDIIQQKKNDFELQGPYFEF